MLDRWINAKPWTKKKVFSGNTPATSATSATSGQGSRGFVADVADVAGASPKNTFLRAPLKPWAKKKAFFGNIPATSATSATNGQGGRGFVANVADVAGASPENTFLRAPLRMLDGRRQYRVPTTRAGAVTPSAVALVAEAKAAHVVVVADGAELHIYTPLSYRRSLHRQLAAQAPDVLAVLRQQSAQRIASAAADRFRETRRER